MGTPTRPRKHERPAVERLYPLTEAEWLGCFHPFFMLGHRPLFGGQTRRLRLFGCACCRQLGPWLADPRLASLPQAIDAAERYADREISPRHLSRWWSAVADILEGLSNRGDRWEAGCAACRAVLAVLLPDRQEEWKSAVAEVYDHPEAFGPVFAEQTRAILPELLRDIVGNPFHPVAFSSSWRTATAVSLARQMHDARDFGAMPILADALQDAGCEDASILDHCRGPGPHVRGCWVVDLVLGKE
jgi:hypothetical protein